MTIIFLLLPLPLLKEESINGGTCLSLIIKLMLPIETAQHRPGLHPPLYEFLNLGSCGLSNLVATIIQFSRT